MTILYRFASPGEYQTSSMSRVFSLSDIIQNLGNDSRYILSRLNISKLKNLNESKRFGYRLTPIIYNLESSSRRPISLGTYLSTNKGAGGNIIGFQKYHNSIEEDNGRIGTISGAIMAFADGRDLIFLAPQDFDLNTIAWPETSITTSYVPLVGNLRNDEYGRIVGHEAGTIFYPIPNVVQMFYAGSLMPEPNNSEVNFVGDAKLVGFRLEIFYYNSEMTDYTKITTNNQVYHTLINLFLYVFKDRNFNGYYNYDFKSII